jgi:hypothetical protein
MKEMYHVLTEFKDFGEELKSDDGEVLTFPSREAAEEHRLTLDDPQAYMSTYRFT